MKHILIIGGSKGLGLACSHEFTKAGWSVTTTARQGWVKCDMTSLSSIKALAVLVDPVDAVIFCQRYRGADHWEELKVNLSACDLVHELVDQGKLRQGSVVMVGSVVANYVNASVSLPYHCAKAALREAVRCLAVEFGPQGLRVNMVSPGTFSKDDQFVPHEGVLSVTPLRRFPTAEQVARAVLFLAGEDSAAITGQEIVVDCGLSLVHQETIAKQL